MTVHPGLIEVFSAVILLVQNQNISLACQENKQTNKQTKNTTEWLFLEVYHFTLFFLFKVLCHFHILKYIKFNLKEKMMSISICCQTCGHFMCCLLVCFPAIS